MNTIIAGCIIGICILFAPIAYTNHRIDICMAQYEYAGIDLVTDGRRAQLRAACMQYGRG